MSRPACGGVVRGQHLPLSSFYKQFGASRIACHRQNALAHSLTRFMVTNGVMREYIMLCIREREILYSAFGTYDALLSFRIAWLNPRRFETTRLSSNNAFMLAHFSHHMVGISSLLPRQRTTSPSRFLKRRATWCSCAPSPTSSRQREPRRLRQTAARRWWTAVTAPYRRRRLGYVQRILLNDWLLCMMMKDTKVIALFRFSHAFCY